MLSDDAGGMRITDIVWCWPKSERGILGRGAVKMMNEQQAVLHRFFSDKAKHLKNEIDLEIEKIGGENMLISREDLIHWVYYARDQVETYYTVCRMLENKADGINTDQILKDLRETMETDQTEIAKIRRRQEEERKALTRLEEEARYYRQTLDYLVT